MTDLTLHPLSLPLSVVDDPHYTPYTGRADIEALSGYDLLRVGLWVALEEGAINEDDVERAKAWLLEMLTEPPMRTIPLWRWKWLKRWHNIWCDECRKAYGWWMR